MSRMVVDKSTCDLCGKCVESCPFSSLTLTSEGIVFGEGCRLCRICVKACPKGSIVFEKSDDRPKFDKAGYSGILVFVEQRNAEIQPVSFEMIGKGLELARSINQKARCILIGHNLEGCYRELLHYGIDEIYVYDHPELADFRIEPYTNALCRLASELKPNIILIGATSMGRSIAPRVSTRLRTGLTADCTTLEVRPQGDLVQIRPAFGGNIMAQIITPNHRPQIATVRYKVMDAAVKSDAQHGQIIKRTLPSEMLSSGIEVLKVVRGHQSASISEADVIVAAGRGVGSRRGIELAEQLARTLGGMVGVTRPLIEKGLAAHTQQIGLSGRTVKPKLYIACGISGAIQHIAGMKGASTVFAINSDPNAPIFEVANYAVIGDAMEILPRLIAMIGGGSGE